MDPKLPIAPRRRGRAGVRDWGSGTETAPGVAFGARDRPDDSAPRRSGTNDDCERLEMDAFVRILVVVLFVTVLLIAGIVLFLLPAT